MATTASSAANSASLISQYSSIDSSISRSRRDSSPWMASGDSNAIHDHPAPPLVPQDDHFSPPVTRNVSPPTGKVISDNHDNAVKKPVWNKPSTSSSEVGPVMGAASYAWPALTVSARASSNKSPSLESAKGLSDGSSSSPMQAPQAAGTPLSSTSNATVNAIANVNAIAGSSVAFENHTVNVQRKPFRRNNNNNNNTSSSTSYISNPPNVVAPAPLNTRDQNHSQRGGGSYGSGTSHFRNNSHRNRNNDSGSYPRGDGFHHGNRRNHEHGNQSGFSHHRNNNYNGRDMHLQPQRGFGVMRPQMMMGPPSFPASSAQYMAATQIGSYGGPMLYQDYAPHIFMPHPPPDPMALVGVGQFSPLPMYLASPDAMLLYSKILTQVEYYFSADNLSRDQYLRGCMNDEGWVPVRIIAGFRRLAELTNNIQTILEALRSSEVVEVKGETLRRRGDWDKYLLPREPSRSGPASSSNNASLGSQLEGMTLSES